MRPGRMVIHQWSTRLHEGANVVIAGKPPYTAAVSSFVKCFRCNLLKSRVKLITPGPLPLPKAMPIIYQ